MEKLNKLSLPATILIASIILGGFYYASEANKQASIERQQQLELQAKQAQQQADLQAKKDEDATIASQKSQEAFQKSLCVSQAMQEAEDFYKANCSFGCKDGQYYVANYDNSYSTCLQSKGLK